MSPWLEVCRAAGGALLDTRGRSRFVAAGTPELWPRVAVACAA